MIEIFKELASGYDEADVFPDECPPSTIPDLFG